MRKLEVPNYGKEELIDGVRVFVYGSLEEHILRMTDKINEVVEHINNLEKEMK